MQPEKTFLVCSTPRSGTTWLCDLMASTKQLGYPGEFFSPVQDDYYERLIGRKSLDCFPAVFDLVLRLGSTPNRTFSVKLFWNFLVGLEAAFHKSGYDPKLDGLDILREQLPRLKVVRLLREDKLRQAISLYKATQTNIWWKNPTVPVEQDRKTAFDFNAIQNLRNELIAEETAWSARLANFPVPQIVILYQDMLKNPDETIAQVADFTECPKLCSKSEAASKFEIQSDDITDQWVIEFKRISALRRVVS